MNALKETARFSSQGDEMVGVLFRPEGAERSPVLIVCHGAGEFKENYFELCGTLAERGVAALAIDMHGHGQSAGERAHVDMDQWVPDVRAAADFLQTHPQIDGKRIGAFGLSSGGTAILEAALVDTRLKALIALDATVRDSLPMAMSLFMKLLVGLGRIKKTITGSDWRVGLAKLAGGFHLASDPEVDKRLQADPRALEAFNAFPFPGAAEAFFVDTLKRVHNITVPTLVIWGEDDQLDPPETGRLLFAALSCKKELRIIPGNGHVGHLDRNRDKVFSLTADWCLENLA
jgi:alpha-beta hydrolase superfamily lysophospholipase